MIDNVFRLPLQHGVADVVANLGARQVFIRNRTAHGETARLNGPTAPCKPNTAYRQVFDFNGQEASPFCPWMDHHDSRRRYSALGGNPRSPTLTNFIARYIRGATLTVLIGPSLPVLARRQQRLGRMGLRSRSVLRSPF